MTVSSAHRTWQLDAPLIAQPQSIHRLEPCHDEDMSVSHEADPGCSALGHLFRPEGDHKVCITCGHTVPTTPGASTQTDDE